MKEQDVKKLLSVLYEIADSLQNIRKKLVGEKEELKEEDEPKDEQKKSEYNIGEVVETKNGIIGTIKEITLLMADNQKLYILKLPNTESLVFVEGSSIAARFGVEK